MSIFDRFHANREQHLLNYHDQLVRELFCLYGIHETNIRDFQPTQSELAELNEAAGAGIELRRTRYGRALEKRIEHMSGASGNIRVQKVIYDETKTCNGLPRRK